MTRDASQPDPTPVADSLDEQLVAYLDGELDSEETRRVEELISADPKARQALERLERTWNLLEELNRSELDDRFTHTTLEIVAHAAEEEVQQLEAEKPRRRRRRWLLGTAGLVAMATVGFLAVLLFQPDPNAELLQDLPAIEDFDEYHQIDDIEFLRLLYRHEVEEDAGALVLQSVLWPQAADVLISQALFLVAWSHADGSQADGSQADGSQADWADVPADESLAERRVRVASMGVAAKEDLLDHQRRFARAEPAEQERVRRLHEEVEQDPRTAELHRVMQEYYDWLRTLPAYQQADLRDLPPKRRVAQIKRILEDQARRSAKGPAFAEVLREYRNENGPILPAGKKATWLSPADVEGLLRWIDQYAKRHGTQFLENLPASQRQGLTRELTQTTDTLRRQETLALMWLRWQLDNPGKLPPLTDQDWANLRANLSPQTRQRLEAKAPLQQWRIISSVIPLFVLQQYAARRSDGAIPAVSEEELANFFEKVVSPQRRDQLMSMPGEEMTRDLWRMYIRWKLTQLPHPPDRGQKDKRPHRPMGKPLPRSGSAAHPATKPSAKPPKS